MSQKKLVAKWLKAKSDLAKATAKESQLREEISLTIAKDADKLVVEIPDVNQKITFRKQINYSTPKAQIVALQSKLKPEVFNNVFTTSYKLKPAAYKLLTGKARKSVEAVVTEKPAPLKVEIAEL